MLGGRRAKNESTSRELKGNIASALRRVRRSQAFCARGDHGRRSVSMDSQRRCSGLESIFRCDGCGGPAIEQVFSVFLVFCTQVHAWCFERVQQSSCFSQRPVDRFFAATHMHMRKVFSAPDQVARLMIILSLVSLRPMMLPSTRLTSGIASWSRQFLIVTRRARS